MTKRAVDACAFAPSRARMRLRWSRTTGVRWLTISAAALTLFAGLTGAAFPPGPAAAQTEIRSSDPIGDARAAALRACGDVLAPAPFARTYAQRVDLNGDGVRDVAIAYGMPCAGRARAFCGPAGCPVEVFVSTPAGDFRRVGAFRAEAVFRASHAGEPALRLEGARCGDVACAPLYAWTGAALERVDAEGPSARPSAAPVEAAGANPVIFLESQDRAATLLIGEDASGAPSLTIACRVGPAAIALQAALEPGSETAWAAWVAGATLSAVEAEIGADPRVAAALAEANAALAASGLGPIALRDLRLEAISEQGALERRLAAIAERCAGD